MLEKVYTFKATSKKITGLLKYMVKNLTVEGNLYIAGDKLDFEDPEGKTFEVDINFVKAYDTKTGKDLSGIVTNLFGKKLMDLNIKDEKVVYSNSLLTGNKDDKDFTVDYTITNDNWVKANAAIQLKVKRIFSNIDLGIIIDFIKDIIIDKPIEQPKKKVHTTAFLINKANYKQRPNRLCDPSFTDDERRNLISYNKSQGYTWYYVMAANYDPRYTKYCYKKEDKLFWRRWLQAVRDSGSNITLWLRSDDSPDMDKWGFAKQKTFFKQVINDLDDLVDEYITGLECNEYFSKAQNDEVIKLIRSLSTKPVAVHTGSINQIDYAKNADAYYLQTSVDKPISNEEIRKQIAAAKRVMGDKPVIYCEYHLSGETARAKEMGDVGIEAGAKGAGCGCTERGIRILGGDVSQPPADGALRDEWTPSAIVGQWEHQNKKIDCKVWDVKNNGTSTISWKDNRPKDWPSWKLDNGKVVQGYVQVFIIKPDRVIARNLDKIKFDSTRDLGNMFNGPFDSDNPFRNPANRPVPGDRWTLCIISKDGRRSAIPSPVHWK